MEKEIKTTTEKAAPHAAAPVAAHTAHVSADSLLKTSHKTMMADAKETQKKALYQNANRPRKPAFEEVAVGEVQSKLIGVRRITKVVKGGRTLRFNAVVIVGDKNGRVAVGNGKAREVSEAIKKAEQDGRKNFITVPIVENTLPHEAVGRFGTSSVTMIPAKEGHGIIAGGPVRAVLELAGYHDVSAKCHGSTNSTNVVKAVVNGLSQLRTREQIMTARGLDTHGNPVKSH
jgi:small subunit ribosomal protein S5